MCTNKNRLQPGFFLAQGAVVIGLEGQDVRAIGSPGGRLILIVPGVDEALPQLDFQLLAGIFDPVPVFGGQMRLRQEDAGDVMSLDGLLQAVQAVDGDAVHDSAHMLVLGVHDAGHGVGRALLQDLDRLLTQFPGADDQSGAGLFRPPSSEEGKDPLGEAGGQDQQQLKGRAEDIIGIGHAAVQEVSAQELDPGGEGGGGEDAQQVVDAGVPPDSAVEPEEEEDDETEQGIPGGELIKGRKEAGDLGNGIEASPRIVDGNPEHQRKIIGEVHREDIQQDQPPVVFYGVFQSVHVLRPLCLCLRFAQKLLIFSVLHDGDFGICRVIGADQSTDPVPDVLLIGIGRVHQVFQIPQQPVLVEGDGLADVDEVVVRLPEALFGHELLLIELLAWAETGVLYFDIHVGLEAAEADEVAGQGVDLHGAAHVQDEDLAAVGIGPGQHDQTDRLGDRHEIADDVGMGDRDGAALLDLPLKNGDHGAVGAQDIAEADGDELGPDVPEDAAAAVPVGVLLPDVGEELWDV